MENRRISGQAATTDAVNSVLASEDLATTILTFGSAADLCAAAATCKTWRTWADSDVAWEAAYKQGLKPPYARVQASSEHPQLKRIYRHQHDVATRRGLVTRRAELATYLPAARDWCGYSCLVGLSIPASWVMVPTVGGAMTIGGLAVAAGGVLLAPAAWAMGAAFGASHEQGLWGKMAGAAWGVVGGGATALAVAGAGTLAATSGLMQLTTTVVTVPLSSGLAAMLAGGTGSIGVLCGVRAAKARGRIIRLERRIA